MEVGEEGRVAEVLPFFFFAKHLGLLDNGGVVAARRQSVFNVFEIINVFQDLVNVLLVREKGSVLQSRRFLQLCHLPVQITFIELGLGILE